MEGFPEKADHPTWKMEWAKGGPFCQCSTKFVWAMNSCLSGGQFVQTSLSASCNSQYPRQPAKAPSACPGTGLQVRCPLCRQKSRLPWQCLKTMLFSASDTKVRAGIYLLINKHPALCSDTKLPKKTQAKSVTNTVLNPLRLLTSKSKSLIKECSLDTHLEVNNHILLIVTAD